MLLVGAFSVAVICCCLCPLFFFYFGWDCWLYSLILSKFIRISWLLNNLIVLTLILWIIVCSLLINLLVELIFVILKFILFYPILAVYIHLIIEILIVKILDLIILKLSIKRLGMLNVLLLFIFFYYIFLLIHIGMPFYIFNIITLRIWLRSVLELFSVTIVLWIVQLSLIYLCLRRLLITNFVVFKRSLWRLLKLLLKVTILWIIR